MSCLEQLHRELKIDGFIVRFLRGKFENSKRSFLGFKGIKNDLENVSEIPPFIDSPLAKSLLELPRRL